MSVRRRFGLMLTAGLSALNIGIYASNHSATSLAIGIFAGIACVVMGLGGD